MSGAKPTAFGDSLGIIEFSKKVGSADFDATYNPLNLISMMVPVNEPRRTPCWRR